MRQRIAEWVIVVAWFIVAAWSCRGADVNITPNSVGGTAVVSVLVDTTWPSKEAEALAAVKKTDAEINSTFTRKLLEEAVKKIQEEIRRHEQVVNPPKPVEVQAPTTLVNVATAAKAAISAKAEVVPLGVAPK